MFFAPPSRARKKYEFSNYQSILGKTPGIESRSPGKLVAVRYIVFKLATTLQKQDTTGSAVLYMALELSNAKWKVGFSNGEKIRQVTITARDLGELEDEIEKARELERLKKERTSHRNRIRSLLILHGIVLKER